MEDAETPRLQASRRKKIGSAPVCRRVESTAWRIHRSRRAFPRRVHSIGATLGPFAPLGWRRRTAPPPENGRPAAKIATRKTGAPAGDAGTRAVRPWFRHARLDHRTHRRPDLAPLPGTLLPRLCEAPIDATPRLEVAQTHLVACEDNQDCPDLSTFNLMTHGVRSPQLLHAVLPRRRAGFARMKSGVGLQRRCWQRRSFEPILNLRVPESDGPCAWPAADFGPLRESLTAGAGRPLFTGGSGSSSTRRSGPLHFFVKPHVLR